MHSRIVVAVVLLCIFMSAFTAKNELLVTSSAFANNEMIPSQYTCEGHEMSPPLKLGNIPPRTQTIAIIVHDPDAPMKGGFTHWVIWNLPVREDVPENFAGGHAGMNSGKKMGYAGMCPPTGTHHYHFKVYALDTKLDMPDNTDKAALEKAIKGHILAQGELVGLYKKIKG